MDGASAQGLGKRPVNRLGREQSPYLPAGILVRPARLTFEVSCQPCSKEHCLKPQTHRAAMGVRIRGKQSWHAAH